MTAERLAFLASDVLRSGAANLGTAELELGRATPRTAAWAAAFRAWAERSE